MNTKDSFILYSSMLQSTKKLSLEQKGLLFEMIIHYHTTGEVLEVDDLAVDIYFDLIKNQMDRDKQKYEDKTEKRREAGKKGGRPKKSEEDVENQTEAKKANGFDEKAKKANGFLEKLNDNENVNENVNENEKEKGGECERGEKSQSNLATRDNFSRNKDSPYLEDAKEVAEYLAERIKRFNPKAKPKPKGWIRDIDLAMRIDGRSKEELLRCIDWIYETQEGSFWIPNILSGKKLREKFDTMQLQAQRSGSKKPLAVLNELHAEGWM